MHTILNHPLAGHRLAMMRDKATPPRTFRALADEVAGFLAYEALRDAHTRPVEVATPLAVAQGTALDEPGLVVVPILRAGMGMLPAVLRLVPDAQVGVLGLRRDEATATPVPYYANVPRAKTGRALALVLDPMLATGGSACDAVAEVKRRGYTRIRFLCLVAAPQGLARLEREHPDVPIFAAARDERLNERFYIEPGLGDAGDRIFGTIADGHGQAD